MFPPHYVHPRTGRELKGVLLEYIIGSVEGSAERRAEFFENGGPFFTSSILNHCFSTYAQNIPYQNAGPFRYLTGDQLNPPTLPAIFWELYNHNP